MSKTTIAFAHEGNFTESIVSLYDQGGIAIGYVRMVEGEAHCTFDDVVMGRAMLGWATSDHRSPGYIVRGYGNRAVLAAVPARTEHEPSASVPIVTLETRKIDLDELERKARAATQGPWAAGRPGESHDTVFAEPDGDLYDVATGCCDADGEYIAANSPPVTLVLVARIRELEDALRSAVGLAEAHDPTGFYPDWLELLEKGAVLP